MSGGTGSGPKYDFALLAAFEPCERGDSKYAFYNDIGALVERLGKRIFLPHRDMDLALDGTMMCAVAKEAIIHSDLALCYTGLESTAAGIMLRYAQEVAIPIVIFREKNVPPYYDCQGDAVIAFATQQQALEKIELFLKNYSRSR